MIIVGYAIPGFLFAILLIILFAGGSFFSMLPAARADLGRLVAVSAGTGRSLDYFWHITLPLIAMALGAFATMTLLTKNSFLDEIRKQYVMTARAKGCSERQVLYGHVFRNAMLIVIAGFPGAFIHAFFSGSLLIETIFSLDGLGLLSFESVLNRDYPVVFGTLFIFSLVGLVVNLISDLTYMLDRSADRFRGAGGLMTMDVAPPTGRDHRRGRRSARRVPPARQPLALSPLNRRRWQNFKANRRGYWSFWIFLDPVRGVAVRRVHRQRPAVPDQVRRPYLLCRPSSTYPETDLRRRFRDRGRLPRSLSAEADRGQGRLHASGRRSAIPTTRINLDLPTPAPSPPTWMLTRSAVQGGRRAARALKSCRDLEYNWLGTDDQGRDVRRAPDLRLPHLGAVRPDA